MNACMTYFLGANSHLSQRWRALGWPRNVQRGHPFAVLLLTVFVCVQSTQAKSDALETAISACSNHENADALERALVGGPLQRVAPDAGKLAIEWYGIPFETLVIGLTTDTTKQGKRISRLKRLLGQTTERLAENGKAILTFSPQYVSGNGRVYVATNTTAGFDADYPTDCMIFVADAEQLDRIWARLDASGAPGFDPAWATFRGDKGAQKSGGVALAALFDRTRFSNSFRQTLKPAGYVTIVNTH